MNKRLAFLISWIVISSTAYAKIPELCNANAGLALLDQNPLPKEKIDEILVRCDKQLPNDVQVLLLHGLLERKLALETKQFGPAIVWLEKSAQAAPPNALVPAQELALTYEWTGNLDKAKKIYEGILKYKSNYRAALLGLARVDQAQGSYEEAAQIYRRFIKKNDQDIEALLGLAAIAMASHDYTAAKNYLETVQRIDSDNAQAILGLQQIVELTRVPEIQSEPAPEPEPEIVCEANQGLALLNQEEPPVEEIKAILLLCDKAAPDDVQTLLLHGLLARKEGLPHKQYHAAIAWLEKAVKAAPQENHSPALELAVTYEWSAQPKKAEAIYEKILSENSDFRAALLGLARTERAQEKFKDAQTVYQKLIEKNPHDLDALNGIAWIALAQKEFAKAQKGFEDVLALDKSNKEAETGLEQVKKAEQAVVVAAPAPAPVKPPPPPLCEANKGLILLNQANPPYAEIQSILEKCDKNTPNDVQALLLHGLLARKQAETTHQFQEAILWLQKAQAAAEPNNYSPTLELAVTYEWLGQPDKAQQLYDNILSQDPTSRPALLGLARVARAQYHIKKSTQIYNAFLEKNPHDIDALNGLGWVNLTNNKFGKSRMYFDEVETLQPNNKEAEAGLGALKNATRYLLSETNGFYTVTGEHSVGTNLFFSGFINATDQIQLLATHNTREIGAAFFTTPTLLPKNSLLVGFQRQYPSKYGWGASYDYREHSVLPLENRAAVNGDVFLKSNFQWFAGSRIGWGSPWKNQLYYSGMTLFTKIPVNITLTGFWAHNEIGGRDNSYVLDFSKELSNRTYYDIGAAYDPVIPSWEVHGRFVLMLFKNQGLEGAYQHYFFNSSTFATVGWRVYW